MSSYYELNYKFTSSEVAAFWRAGTAESQSARHSRQNGQALVPTDLEAAIAFKNEMIQHGFVLGKQFTVEWKPYLTWVSSASGGHSLIDGYIATLTFNRTSEATVFRLSCRARTL